MKAYLAPGDAFISALVDSMSLFPSWKTRGFWIHSSSSVKWGEIIHPVQGPTGDLRAPSPWSCRQRCQYSWSERLWRELEMGSTCEWLAGSRARVQPSDSWESSRSAGSRPAAGKAVGLGRPCLASASSSLLYLLNHADGQKEASTR